MTFQDQDTQQTLTLSSLVFRIFACYIVKLCAGFDLRESFFLLGVLLALSPA